jgi:hypothetical protein
MLTVARAFMPAAPTIPFMGTGSGLLPAHLVIRDGAHG